AAERHLRRITGLPVARSQNMMDGVGLKDTLAEVAGALRLASMNIAKMASDMLFYTSSAVGEFIHPPLQYGSSMMPLKTNPVLLERCRGLALSAMGEADKVHLFAGEGALQLNAWLPFLLRSLIACAEESRTARDDFRRFLAGVEPDAKRMERNLSRSPALLNALMPLVGYRNLKSLESTLAAEAPETLAELAELTAKETGIDLSAVLDALKPSRLTGPPKENS
ncbi:MAG: lyase family protein, partial [Spirochaetaceae bacterium]|nr:lyase family protein [Spirochaetaceae bacterium]